MEIELVSVSLAVNFAHNVFVVVVSKGSRQLVVVHVGFGLPLAPSFGCFVRVDDFEFSRGALPLNAV